MAEPLKNYFNKQFVIPFSEVCKRHVTNFNQEHFINTVFDDNWENLEMKPRIKHIAASLHKQLSNNISDNLKLITAISEDIRINQNKQDTFEYLVLSDYIEVFGIDELNPSLKAIEKVTVLATCEFAIRPFILNYPNETFEQLYIWSKHELASVRRLSSEGCRPRLPWGMGIPELKKDPSPIFQILETLKDDPSLYVRRSVANNINDISKEHPKRVLALLKEWNHFSEERDWLVKHAARTLLKKGNPEALALFGYGDFKNFSVANFSITSNKVTVGDYLNFEFSIKNNSNAPQKVRLEYFIYFLLANGKQSKKIYKISERTLSSNEKLEYNRKQSFKIISTRTYYTGIHKISLVINGVELNTVDFNLQKN
jgi:3-methyladenine DNA glycosylase AlkC